MDHNNSEGDGMMMMMMPMYFGCPVDNIYLFKLFTSSNAGTFIAWLVAITLMSLFVQVLTYCRSQLQNKTMRDILRLELDKQTNL